MAETTIQLGVGEGLQQRTQNGTTSVRALTSTSAAYEEVGAGLTLFFPLTIPSAARRRIIKRLTITAPCWNSTGANQSMYARVLGEAYDAAKIAAGERLGDESWTPKTIAANSQQTLTFAGGEIAAGRGRIENGIAISGYKGAWNGALYAQYAVGSGSGAKPVVELTTDDATVHAGEFEPGAGSWMAPNAENTIRWRAVPDGATMEPIKWSSAVVEWKDGPSGEVHTVTQAASPAAEVGSTTFAANTFPSTSQLMIRWTLTTEDGVTETSPEWQTYTTADPVPTVTGVSPRNSYFSDDADVTFAWDYSISTGTAPTAYAVQARAAGTDTWEDVASGAGSAQTVTVPVSSLPTGIVEWRARAANTQGVYSAWSSPLTFSAVGAPNAPTVTVERAAPVPVIAWQAVGQQGYRIRCGAYDSGPVYGTGKRAELPVVLPDGAAVAEVQITNNSGLWSEWTAAAFTVTNVPAGDAALLAASGGIDVTLTWNAVTGAVRYDILRDGVRIGQTTATVWRDMTHAGAAAYAVRTIFADGSYSVSAAQTAAAETDGPVIARAGGEWLPIKLSDRELPEAAETLGAGVILVQLAGAAYPTAIRTAQRSRRYGVAFATRYSTEAAAFEALIGETVIVRDQYGRSIVGVMGEASRTQNAMYITMTATVEEVDPDGADV